jgi:hypothetical protein
MLEGKRTDEGRKRKEYERIRKNKQHEKEGQRRNEKEISRYIRCYSVYTPRLLRWANE